MRAPVRVSNVLYRGTSLPRRLPAVSTAYPREMCTAGKGEADSMGDRHRSDRQELESLFPWLHWGFRDGEEVSGYCLAAAKRTTDAMKRIPFSSVEDQLEARNFTVGEFKEGEQLGEQEEGEEARGERGAQQKPGESARVGKTCETA